LIFNTAQSRDEFLKSFNIAISKISLAQKTNYAFGVFHFSGRRYDIRDSDEYFYERSFGAYFALSYPFSFFRRLEASISIANSDKEVFFTSKNRKALLLTNSISYVFDNSLWASSGPIDGSRFMILLGQTNDIKFSNVNYFSFMLDYRYYLRLGLKSALATRFQFFFNEGREARRFFMGGNWDLRGYPRWSIRGEKLWLTSMEFRFPLVDQITIKFPFLTMNLFEFRGATFFDMGNAWDVKYEQTLGSVGFGIRMNLFGVLVLRYDIGKRIENGFRNFQDGLFYQFFFGWDF
jgi:outer membrane protein assembly factor BamA